MPPKGAKRGKENAPPKKAKNVEAIEDDFDGMGVEPVVEPVKKKPGRPAKGLKAQPTEMAVDEPPAAPRPTAGDADLEKQLAQMTAERDRMRRERDVFAKQFEELSRLRHSEPEGLLAKFKEQAAAVSKAQTSLIENLTALDEKKTARITDLEQVLASTQTALDKATERADAAVAPAQLDTRLDGKSEKELRQEVHKLRKTLQTREEQMEQLQREYNAEVVHSRRLQEQQARGSSVAPGASHTKESDDIDHESLKLYEDLTNLGVLHVSVRRGKTGKETSYNCIQTVGDKSFAFKVRKFNEYNRATKKWDVSIEILPDPALASERDEAFVARLGPFTKGFTIPREQLPLAWNHLRSRMDPDGEYPDPDSAGKE